MADNIEHLIHMASAIVAVGAFGLWFETKQNRILFWAMLVCVTIFLLTA